MGFCLPNGGHTLDFHLFDGLSGMVFILMPSAMLAVFHASFLWWEFKMSLVMNSHSRALFIAPCSQCTSSGRPVGLALEGNSRLGTGGDTCHVWSFWCCMCGGWLTDQDSVKGACSGVASPREACREVAMVLWAAGSIPFRPRWISHTGGGWNTHGGRWQLSSGCVMLRSGS